MASRVLKLYQPEEGYCYTSDTLFLYHFIHSLLKPPSPPLLPLLKPKNILDIGCGCGILGLLCARDFPNIQVDLLEKEEVNAKIAKINAKRFKNTQVIHTDLFDYSPKIRYDLIVSNPPFYRMQAMSAKNVYLQNAKSSQSMPPLTLARHLTHLLSQEGKIILCYDAREIFSLLEAFKQHKIHPLALRFIHALSHKEAKIALLYAKRGGGNSMLKILPPLLVQEKDQITTQTKEVYDLCNTHSIKVKIQNLIELS